MLLLDYRKSPIQKRKKFLNKVGFEIGLVRRGAIAPCRPRAYFDFLNNLRSKKIRFLVICFFPGFQGISGKSQKLVQ